MTDPCVYCDEDTGPGSGRFVNRIPADTYDDDGTYREGYLCAECQAVECDKCGKPSDDWQSTVDGDPLCTDCLTAGYHYNEATEEWTKKVAPPA